MRRITGDRRLVVSLVTVAVFVLFMVALFEKSAILTALKPGDTIKAEFARDYKLQAGTSQVKMAGTPVGVVSAVHPTGHGTVSVSLKVRTGVLDKLGTTPTAEIRPTTILGGKYYVSLVSGGARGTFTGTIPADRTRTPVELDQVLQAFPEGARQGLRKTTGELDQTLGESGKAALRRVLKNAPGTLRPAGTVADALRGTRPDRDLTATVTDVDTIANVLTRRDGQLGDLVDSLDTTTSVLARQSRPLAATVATLPSVLRDSRTGLDSLGSILDRVPATADAARPAVRQLDPTLRELNPVLAKARPVVADLRPLLEQARPVVDELVPTSRQGTSVLNDLRGPVLDRVNGPIIGSLMSEWHGTAPKYPNGGDGAKFYQEIAYLVSNINDAVKVYDQNGFMINFALGAGTSSVMDAPGGLDQLLKNLSSMMGPPHQYQDLHSLTPLIETLQGLAPQQFGQPTVPQGKGPVR